MINGRSERNSNIDVCFTKTIPDERRDFVTIIRYACVNIVGVDLAFPSSGPLNDACSGPLRYGLLEIKPVQIVETIKRCGLKFRRTIRKFEPISSSKSYADLVKEENDAIFSVIRIPEWFDHKELATSFSQRSIERYEKDSELKEAVERMKTTERKDRPLTSFVQFMKQRFESRRDKYLEVEAQRFLNSNFPLSFYNKFVILDNTYYDFVTILERIVRRDESLGSVARSYPMYESIFKGMKRKIRPLLDQIDACLLSCLVLKKYIMVWNSKNYEEIFDPEFLDIKNVDFSEYENLRIKFNAELTKTRQLLMRSDASVFQKKIDSEGSTKKAFGKLVMFPSDHLRLES